MSNDFDPKCCLPWRRPTAALLCIAFLIAAPPRQSLGQTSGQKVALVDVGEVLRRLDRFEAMVRQMHKDVAAFESEVRQQRLELQQTAEKNKEIRRPAFREHARTEWTKSVGQLELRRELKRQAIAQQEARMYLEAYRDLQRELETLCRQHKIDVVLRFDRSPVNSHDREEVLKRCNSDIIYQNRLDLTDLLITRLNAKRGWVNRPYGAPTVRGKLAKQSKWLTTIPAIAAQQVLTARTAWAIDRTVFPDGS